jgi:hypothetical protein
MKRTIPFLTLLLGLAAADLFAMSPEQQGLDIATESFRRDSGFGDSEAQLTMVLSNLQGQETVRELRRKTLEVPGDGDKSMNVFDSPFDVTGTTVLTYSHALQPDDQWIFLPALKRVKRISSVNKSGPFMGSEFAFEDLSRPEVEKYKYKYLGNEVVDGADCFVLELIPAYEHSGYIRLVQWLDKTMYQPRKVVYYDRKNTILKTLVHNDYQQYLGRYWRPNLMIMENHQTGKKTTLRWKEYRFRVGLGDPSFSLSALERGR